jgi:hypothetical protein
MKISQVLLGSTPIKHRFTTPDRLYRMLPLSRETDPRWLVSGVNSRDMTLDMTLLHAGLTAICGLTPLFSDRSLFSYSNGPCLAIARGNPQKCGSCH